MKKFYRIEGCRICQSKSLISILSLGDQVLTGVFPKNENAPVTVGPLELVWCIGCGLLQLCHSYDPGEMYGKNYGYRSGLNQTMVQHLTNKVHYLSRFCPLTSDDVVLDIGSNDGTLLSAYDVSGLNRIGIDPTGVKFTEYYSDGIELVPDFFTTGAYRSKSKGRQARIITSIAMFYDLQRPDEFVSDIVEVLADDGIWHFEQSYMPTMLRMNSYDTICHEHLEYYSLRIVKELVEQHDLKIIDVQMNSVNGGSFAVTVAKKQSALQPNNTVIDWLLGQEDRMGLNTPRPYRDFEERVFRHRDDLIRLIRGLREDDNKIVGYGASTKGNVLLQFCGFDSDDIECIADVNPDKFGALTPGTHIPILSEAEVRLMKPDYMLVLPWHFRDSIIRREASYLASGGKLIFPMPEIEII